MGNVYELAEQRFLESFGVGTRVSDDFLIVSKGNH